MGLQDRLRFTGVKDGEPLEPIHIPALNLIDAFEIFDPWAGHFSPYPWAPLQHRQPAVGGSPAAPDDPEGLNSLAARARQLVAGVPDNPSALAATLDAALVDPGPFGDLELPSVGDGRLAQRLVERAGALDGAHDTTPTLDQWLGLLALALLGKAEQLIQEIDRDAARVFANDPTESEFFENVFNFDRLKWFGHLVIECGRVLTVAETQSQLRHRENEKQRIRSQKANVIRNRPKRELEARAERIYLERYYGSGLTNQYIGWLIYDEIEPYDWKPDPKNPGEKKPIIRAADPSTAVERMVARFKKRYGDK